MRTLWAVVALVKDFVAGQGSCQEFAAAGVLGSDLFRARNAKFLHARDQGCSWQAEAGCGTMTAADGPVGFGESLLNMTSLCVVKRHGGGKPGMGCERQ
jgi:hypothetical protein